MSEVIQFPYPQRGETQKVAKLLPSSWDWGMYLASSSASDDRPDHVN